MAANSSPMFTCISCRVAFVDADLQRSHYKTDWHRYNLKRKVAELPPVSADEFLKRVLAQKEQEEQQNVGKQAQHCKTCRKHFANEKSYENHLRSRKHREAERLIEAETKTHKEPPKTESDDSDIEIIDDGPEPLDTTECLFCPHVAHEMEANMEHMSKAHGFFLPDLEYLTNLSGIMHYLAVKVGVWYTCLYCNEKGKTFHSVEAVQHHMTDKSHCKLFFEKDAALEYAEFYDYSKSYTDYTPDGDKDEEISPDTNSLKVTDDLELVLPSGATVGHRSLKVFYKQRLPSYEKRKALMISRVMSQYRAIGWHGAGADSAQRVRDAQWVGKMKQQRELKIGVRNNKVLLKHLRPQVIF